MRVTLEQANAYFAERLHSAAWEQATDTERLRALATAGRQVGALDLAVGVDAPPIRVLREAICEQALWLLEHSGADRERARAIAGGVTSRRVGDAGESYSERKAGQHGTLAPEASAILGPYLRRRSGGIR
jgi:hypothetical protein